MNGSYGAGMQAFERLFDWMLGAMPWFAIAVSILGRAWIAFCWRDA